MRKIVAGAIILLPAFAQAQSIAPEDYQAALVAVQNQRDVANNQVVEISVKLAKALRELEAIKKASTSEAKP